MARLPLRALIFVAAVGFGAAAVWLLWADSGTILGDRILDNSVEAARWLERTTMLDVINRDDIPAETDEIGHAVLWTIGTVLIGSLRMQGRPLAIVGMEMAALSLFSEFAQPLVSMNRAFEPGDALANLVGVGFGVATLTAVLVLHGSLRFLTART